MANLAGLTFEPLPITSGNVVVFRKKGMLLTMRSDHICPECGEKCYGAYPRWAKEPQYGPYYYAAHPNGVRNGRRWHYLGTLVHMGAEEGDTASKVHSSDFLSTESASPISALEAPNPSLHSKHCAKCGANYQDTTQRRCGCGGFLLLSSRGQYS